MHADQLTVSAQTVRALVEEQIPQWRELPVRAIASQGTVNAIFRIGGELAARLPLRSRDATRTRRELEAEAAAARELAGRTRFRTPEPVAFGEPGAGYPLPWSVQTWLPGFVATAEDHAESAAFARDLAVAVAAAATCGPTTPSWTSASAAASTSWTCPGYAGCGRRCATCRAAPAAT